MAGSTKVRLVRCPKCANLLPEVPDYPLYQCGGCDAVLRAKKKVNVGDVSVEQIGKERHGQVSERLEVSSEKDCGASEIERNGDGAMTAGIKGRAFRERTLNLVSSSSSITEKTEASVHKGCGYVEEINVGYHGGGLGDNNAEMRSSKSVYQRRKEGTGEAPSQFKCSAGSSRPEVTTDQSGLNRYANPGVADDRSKFSIFAYPDEGPSKYHLNSSYGYGVQEHEQAELLRKLNELKEKIIKYCAMDEEQKGRSPVNRKASHLDPYHGRVAYSVPTQPKAPNEHIFPHYVKKYGHRSAFPGNNSDMNMQNFCFPPKQTPNIFSTYEDPLQPQMRSAHSHQLANDHFSAPYTDFNREVLSSYPHDNLYHQSCCNKNSATFRLQTYNAQADPSALQLRAQQMNSRWPGDVDRDHGGFRQSHPRRFVVKHGEGKCCHPIAGGAPFITCPNCFELVKLPRRLKTGDKSQQKLRCGACLMLSLVEVENKRLIVSLPLGKDKKKLDENDDDGSSEFLK